MRLPRAWLRHTGPLLRCLSLVCGWHTHVSSTGAYVMPANVADRNTITAGCQDCAPGTWKVAGIDAATNAAACTATFCNPGQGYTAPAVYARTTPTSGCADCAAGQWGVGNGAIACNPTKCAAG